MHHYSIVDQKLVEEPFDHDHNRKSLWIMSAAEFAEKGFGKLSAQMQSVFLDQSKSPVVDTHPGWSYCFVNAIEIHERELELRPVRFVVTKDAIGIVAEETTGFVDALVSHLSDAQLVQRYEEVSPQTLLLYFFDEMLLYNAAHIETTEDNLESLEENVLEDAKKSYTREIVTLRKLIMRFRHAIEPLIYILDELSDNENHLFSSAQVKALRIQSRRASKMVDSVVLLRDYATQVREAFEAERDIKNNDIMKVFTIVTSVFLPLTLIAGWYGMNFKYMPELSSPYGYPMVIALSVAVVVAMLIYFRRKKWL